MLEVKRKKGESFESMLRRFSRRVQDSGRILQARKIRFHSNSPSKNSLKATALRREQIKEKREYLIKTGKATEEDFRRKKRRGRR
ncbi:MAG: 30S ribosomal protein S21 [Patescibacteria group bacterium]|nr:30S ribosomal protein S21 [Patescibacteria group bacterium]